MAKKKEDPIVAKIAEEGELFGKRLPIAGHIKERKPAPEPPAQGVAQPIDRKQKILNDLLLEAFKGGIFGGNVCIDMKHVKKLLELGADINAKDVVGWSLLSHAARHGMTDSAKELLDLGADINTADRGTGWTPLMSAITNGRGETAQLLITEGTDLNVKDKDGKNAVDHAKANARVSYLAAIMIDLGAKEIVPPKK